MDGELIIWGAVAAGVWLFSRAQSSEGGDAQACVQAGWRGDDRHTSGPIIVNNGRSVLYASRGNEFAAAARKVADETRVLLNAARRLQLTGV